MDLNYAQSFTGQLESSSANPEGEVWRGLLLAVLILLFAEIFLARRFGDYSRRTDKGEVRP